MQTDRSIYLALAELTRRHREAATDTTGPLTEYELCCFSQHGEDGVIAEILRRIGVASGYFVEFGIESGREGNCVFLADVLGWSGLFIEPDEAAHASLSRKYAANDAVATHRAAVTADNVEELFGDGGVPAEPDVLSIDVDGADYWIWERINSYRPRVLVIEYNASIPPGRNLVQPRDHVSGWQGTDYFGASLDALEDLSRRKGYRLVHTELAGANAFFVRGDLAAQRFPRREAVPRRTEPNYFLTGYHHPLDATSRRYAEVSEGVRDRNPRLSPVSPSAPSIEEAQALVARTDFIWHQRFEVAPGVFTPGTNDVLFLAETAKMPETLDGESVLDIGTTNGGLAFELERRGAGRVVAVDILDPAVFGFNDIKALLGSQAEHLKASIYELPGILGEQFDLVVFLGVVYHLRHPLLALDNVRRLTRQFAYIESAVCDAELPGVAGEAIVRFYRRDELAADPTNWFSPTVRTLSDWCTSCGLEPFHVAGWPEGAPSRGMVSARPGPGPPEWQQISYEVPVIGRLGSS